MPFWCQSISKIIWSSEKILAIFVAKLLYRLHQWFHVTSYMPAKLKYYLT
ncbi:hypothetical protein HanRHA438_Chr10g0432801 [Helianthus annuus]|nr:hypothetical protein HanRHA438_Chr10g0432801 [Helianthus annuus]